MNYSSGDLNFIREIKLNEITEKIIRDLLRVDPSHRANSFIIRNGRTRANLGGNSRTYLPLIWPRKSAQLIKFGSEIEIEHSKKQTDAQVVPDLVAPLPLDQKSERNSNKNDQVNDIDQSSMILNFPLGWNKGKKPDLKRLEKVRCVTTVSSDP